MKRLFTILSVIGLLAIQQATATNSELVNNTRVAQPVTAKHPTKMLLIGRYPLADNSEAAYYNMTNSALRDYGSGDEKTINIIWARNSSEKNAIKIRDMLVKKGVSKNKISIVRSNHRVPVYPLYIEVEKIAARSAKCRVDTAEDMMAYDQYDPCATKNNYRIQIK